MSEVFLMITYKFLPYYKIQIYDWCDIVYNRKRSRNLRITRVKNRLLDN